MVRIGEVPLLLQQYVEEEILPRYDSFDQAHRQDHVRKVMEDSMVYARLYPVDLPMCYVIAAYHDLGLVKGREFHHLESGRILEEDVFLKKFFSREQILLMKEAVEDHRASRKDEPRSIYGKIVAEADRVIDPWVTLKRTVQYGLSHYPQMDKEQQYIRFKQHLMQKYAPGGYLRLWIPESLNRERLGALRRILLDEERLRLAFGKIWDSL